MEPITKRVRKSRGDYKSAAEKRVTICRTVLPQVALMLKQQAKEAGLSESRLIERLVMMNS